MDTLTRLHLQRLKNQTINKFSLATIPEWISQNTRVNGNPFSYQGHEYQETILRDTSQEVVVIKSSQMGITEISIRLALALCAVIPNYTLIYTLPTASFASNVMGTRVDPVITESETLKALVSTQINNNEIKQIGSSFLYMKGSASGNAPISIPAHHLIHDEIDFSDQGIIEQYQSRLTHSPYKRKHKFSTPTVPGYGIHEAFMQSRRFYEFLKCNHCNHQFVPDYYEHVTIPSWDRGLEEITKANLHTTKWREAYIRCPKCGKAPSRDLVHREWVLENPDDDYIAAGYYLSPFSATFISPSDLIQASTNYNRRSQFVNFALGKPMMDSESSITREDLLSNLINSVDGVTGVTVMGVDVGSMSYVTVMKLSPDGFRYIIKTAEIPVHQLEKELNNLRVKYLPRMTVIDALPYTETVLRMQHTNPNLFAAFYVERKTLELQYTISKEENREEGKMELNQVNINRSKAFDVLMDDIKLGNIKKVREDHDETWISHLQDMKRVQKFTTTKDLEYVWQKSAKGDDHFHHSLLYAETAARIVGVSSSTLILPSYLSTFKVKKESNIHYA
ncbi:phage terminase large subunit family protein [Oligella urethralis]|uniref:Bacteriophage tail assembly protein n=1 Tax=Oligella urethralis TaxID=90245 RepID=A0A2X1ULR0_9BURK|nr:phage terminase large subunit family protein [Oligella urethralis]SPY08037.1 Bacteriophage tail assembly protein [Oligella urethralis]